jgi:cyclophilin family peptidyl-prolyl cis-trans isomerase
MKLNRFHYFLFVLFFITTLSACNAGKKEKTRFVEIVTDFGTMKIRLYNETPLHRDNFLGLVKSGVYNGITFHRVINKFMIQAGDPETAITPLVGEDSVDLNYTVPAEFHAELFHKKGALAAARMGDQDNPEQASSSSQFYLVQGKKFSDDELLEMEERINNMRKKSIFFKNINLEKERAFEKDEPLDYGKIQQAATLKTEEQLKSYVPYSIPPEHRQVYKTIGGTPHLDGSYTVFGEVVEGIEIIDKIASVETDESDRPVNDIRIRIKRVRR